MNLLTYINHFNTGLKEKLLRLKETSGGCLTEIEDAIRKCGYDVLKIPSILSYTELESFVTELGLPMLVCLELTYPSVTYMHVIGISPCMSAETGKVEFHIIDGSHPEKKAIYFNKQNIDWCFGHELSFQKISCGFVFVPGRKRVLEMFQDKSGYHYVPGTAVCLTKTTTNLMTEGIELGSDDTTSESLVGKVAWLQNKMRQLMEKGLDADLKMEIGTNFSRMMKENVTIKEKREYVVIWKQLREKYRKLG